MWMWWSVFVVSVLEARARLSFSRAGPEMLDVLEGIRHCANSCLSSNGNPLPVGNDQQALKAIWDIYI